MSTRGRIGSSSATARSRRSLPGSAKDSVAGAGESHPFDRALGHEFAERLNHHAFAECGREGSGVAGVAWPRRGIPFTEM